MKRPHTTADVAARLSPEAWTQRLERADAEARILERVLARVHGGESRSAALRAELPEQPVSSTLLRLRRFEQGGRDALLNRRLPVRGERKMNDEARGALRALAVAHPELGSEALAEKLSELLSISVRPTAVQVPTGSGSTRHQLRPDETRLTRQSATPPRSNSRVDRARSA